MSVVLQCRPSQKWRRNMSVAFIAEFAYAHAFFRILNGSKRVTVKDIGWFFRG
jgi:hypothetical protein